MASNTGLQHALHSPNITKAELQAYFAAPPPVRHRHSLVEVSEHDPHLIQYLLSPLDSRLVRELVRMTESVIRIPSGLLAPGAPATPPITPIRNTTQHKKAPVPVYLSPKWKPLEQFVARLIQNSRVRVQTLAYALIILDRLKEKLPPLAQGMQCTRHRIFLAALVVGSKYLNDSTPKNKHWAYYTRDLFDSSEITLMEKQLLALLDFDLRITEEQLVARLSPFIHNKPAKKSTACREVAKAQEGAAGLRAPQPLTPITPITPLTNHLPPSVPTLRVGGVPAEKSSDPDQAFVLQPVPAAKKRGEKASGGIKMESRSAPFSSSQSVPSQMATKQGEKPPLTTTEGTPYGPILALPDIPILKGSKEQPIGSAVPTFKASVAVPLVRSLSSDGLLEGANSMAMQAARTFSSNASSSMTFSSSISASNSTGRSEVGTPVDRPSVWVADTASQHYFQAHPTRGVPANTFRLRRRGSESATIPVPTFMVQGKADSNSKDSGAINKLLSVGKILSPTRRIGHGVKGDRKASTATIVPGDVALEH